MRLVALCLFSLTCIPCASVAGAQPTSAPTTKAARNKQVLANYFRQQTAEIADQSLREINTAQDWSAKREEYRRQLAEMLGLWPMPQRTDLKPSITGSADHLEFTVEKLHFQSLPGLYVTANLYVPKGLSKPAPAILYVCGHSAVKKDGISYGNKVAYQHHGAWFARNGYVCLVLDTLELGEIGGIHHGTYSEGMWWWQSRGYTPAGVEAWNGIRALDYLCTRPEVDASRIGMTGRSGGGAYTWWVAALDDRVKVAAPVAGITDLQNHVVDGCVEGHCDCMYMVNTYRWDFGQVAALVAPRPLLIGNSDKDTIFPLDGVNRVHEQARRIYRLLGAEKNLGLLITEGPHNDTQDLQVPVFRWFNRFLKNETGPVEKVAVTFFEPQQLRVFDQPPADQINMKIQESFVPVAAPPAVPASADAWETQRANWMAELRAKTFGGWPQAPPALDVTEAFSATHAGVVFRALDFTSQQDVRLRLYVAQSADQPPKELVLTVLDESSWPNWLANMSSRFANELADENTPARDRTEFDRITDGMRDKKLVMAWVCPRGIGHDHWGVDEKALTQIRRRFALLGQTLDGMRVWDVRRAVRAIKSAGGLSSLPLRLSGGDRAAGIAIYASLFEPEVAELELHDPPLSHRDGPDLLNVMKVLDLPAALAMAAENRRVRIVQADPHGWEYPAAVAAALHWDVDQLRVEGSTRDSSR